MNSAEREAWSAAKAQALGHLKLIAWLSVAAFVLAQAYCAGVRHQASKDLDARTKTLDSIAKAEKRQHTRDSIDRAIQIQITRAAEARADSMAREFKRRVVVLVDTGKGAHRDVVVSVDGGPPVREIPANLAIPAIQLCQTSDSAGRTLAIKDSIVIDDRNQQLVTANEQTANERAKASLKKGFTLGAFVGSAVTLGVAILLK